MIRITTLVLILLLLSVINCDAQPGSLDSTFGLGGKVTSTVGNGFDVGNSVAIQADGKLVVSGNSYNGTEYDFSLIRYNTDGSPDSTFGTNGRVITVVGIYSSAGEAIAIQPDGKIIVAGSGHTSSYSDFALVRYNTDGTLDPTFGNGGKVITSMGTSSDAAYAVAVQNDGKIVAAGTRVNASTSETEFAIARYNSNGSLDPVFGTGGKVFTTFGGAGSDRANSMVIQPDGKIVVAGEIFLSFSDCDFGMARYNTNGSLDTTFGGTGKVTTPVYGISDEGRSVALQTDGKLVMAGGVRVGSTWNFGLTRNNPDGSIDSTFGVNGVVLTAFGNQNARARSVAIQPNGKIVVSGGCEFTASTSGFALVRYQPNGMLDSTFGITGKVTTTMGNYTAFGFATLLQPDGKIVVAGDNYSGTDNDYAIARYHGDLTTNINTNMPLQGITVYPNPSAGIFTIGSFQDEEHISRIVLFNLLGEKVFESEIIGSRDIDLGILPDGMYVMVSTTSQGTFTQRIVISR